MLTAERVIALLGLQPLPIEGGHFHETYRAGELIERECLPQRYAGARPYGSAIYYLLRDDTYSALHRLHSDEIYHFYSASRSSSCCSILMGMARSSCWVPISKPGSACSW